MVLAVVVVLRRSCCPAGCGGGLVVILWYWKALFDQRLRVKSVDSSESNVCRRMKKRRKSKAFEGNEVLFVEE